MADRLGVLPQCAEAVPDHVSGHRAGRRNDTLRRSETGASAGDLRFTEFHASFHFAQEFRPWDECRLGFVPFRMI
ncbi:hypothetical protein [Rhodoplanes elegans]